MADFITSNFSWDVQKLYAKLLPVDVEILKMPIIQIVRSDWWVWYFDKKWESSVKSGDKCGIIEYVLDKGSCLNWQIDWWSRLWKIKIPAKIVIFVWRSCYDCLPRYSLRERKLEILWWCSCCKKRHESVCHAIFWCSTAKAIWNALSFHGGSKYSKLMSCFDIWLKLAKRFDDDHLTQALYNCIGNLVRQE